MALLAILFAFGIFMNGSSFAAIHGGFALRLDLPGSIVIPYLPWVALAAYLLSVIAIRRIKAPWKRWVSFASATLVGNLVICYPVELLRRESVRIPVADFLTRESKEVFESQYPIRWVSYSTSGEGTCVRVRRDDYSPALAAFVAKLAESHAR